MYKWINIIIGVWLFLCSATIQISATDEDKDFLFNLSVDGKQTKEVETGDIITVVLKLSRVDSEEPYVMYAMQDEIRYDNTFFELVENSVILGEGIVATDIAKVDECHELYMNYLSMSGGTQWNSDVLVGSFQLRVIGKSGVSRITNQDYLVSFKDGSGSYICDAEDVTVILTPDCRVTFKTNGGNKIPDQIVSYGETLAEPQKPIREGYSFGGWYTDIHLTNEWDFQHDVVDENMLLYAKWITDKSEQFEESVAKTWCIWWILLLLILILVLIWIIKSIQKKGKLE